MKVIKTGRMPELEKPWWVNQYAECGNCHTKVQLEANDLVIAGAERRPNGKRWAKFACPFCGVDVDHVEAAMRAISSENVKEHAPLSAGASVDHGVEVETTEEQENTVADRGCCVSTCSPD